MKKYLVLIILTVTSLTVYSQNVKIEESAPLGEFKDGWVDLLQFKNGNTAFLNFSDDDNFVVKLYNPTHKLIADKTIKPAFAKNTIYSFAKSSFVCNNEIVAIFSAIKKVSFFKVSPALYRIILNGTTGAVVKEEEIGLLTEFGAAGEVAFRKHYDGSPDFYISKDPNSDNYAVAHFDSNETDGNKKLKITHYGSEHKVINEGYFLQEGNTNVHYIDMAVIGDSKIYVCANLSNGYTSMVCLNKETPNFTQNTVGKFDISSRLFYDKQKNILILFGIGFVDSKSNYRFMGPSKSTEYYGVSLLLINPTTLKLDFEKQLTGPTLKKDYENIYSPSGLFSGVPYGFYINNDQTYTVLYQELNVVSTYNGSHQSSVNSFFGSIGVSILNDKFQEQSSYLIPASYHLPYEEYNTMSSYNEKASQPKYLKGENQYKLCTYISKKNQKIIFMNDDSRNLEEVKNGKIKLVGSLGGVDGYKVIINEDKMKRENFFSKLEKFSSFGLFIVNHYDASTETFITIMRSNKKGWQNQIVWTKL